MKSLYKLTLMGALLVSLSSTSGWAAVYIWQGSSAKPLLLQSGTADNYDVLMKRYPDSLLYEWDGPLEKFTLQTAGVPVTEIDQNKTYVLFKP